jgi:hypothetical protein
VIEHKHVIRIEKAAQVANMLMKWALRSLVYEQSSGIARLYWRLCNEINRQYVVDIGQLHDLNVRAD